jgi:Ni/Co efflux regulator RcnB
MKRIATAALAVCLMSATSALAQPDDHHKSTGPATPHAATTGATHGPAPGAPHPLVAAPVRGFSPAGRGPGPVTTQAFTGHPTGPTTQAFTGHPSGPTTQAFTGRPNGPTTQAFTGHPNGPRPRYNPQAFPRVFNPGARFHWRGGPWSGPPGFYYRSWIYGQILPFGWYSSQWWVNDYWDYDLPAPPYGYEWVRNGPDALLVDVNTGTIAEVVPGIFY